MPLITDAIGRVLGGRYRLVSPLGVGASAQVFLAEDVTLRRHVAIKVLQPGLANDQGFLKRFRAEARSAAALNHPHIARVFDWGEDEGGPYLVLEYLSGGSLLDLLERGVRLSVPRRRRWPPRPLAASPTRIARGLVHRDIKPANLLFDDEGRVRVADFGVARALADGAWTEPDRRRHRDGALRGAGAGPGPDARRAGRRVLAGTGHLRVVDRVRALRPRHRHGHPGRTDRRQVARARRPRTAAAYPDRGGRARCAGEARRRDVCDAAREPGVHPSAPGGAPA